jgi:uncharacterized protein
MRKGFMPVVFVVMVLGLSLFGGLDQASAQKGLPSMMTWTSYDVGSSGYVQAAAVGDAFTRKKNVKLRVLPAGGDISRLMPLKTGSAGYALTGVGSNFAWQGIYDFASLEWGPQPLRQIWAVLPYGMPLATAADANIKTPRDLKGKRFSWIPGNPTTNIIHEAFLAFGNLTWNDVKKTVFPSFGASLKGMVDGTNDAAFCTSTAAALYELASSPRGLYWPEFPAADKEGWARLLKVAPIFFPDVISAGAGITSPKELPNYSYPVLVCYLKTDENTVYELAKALHETYDVYKNVNISMLGWEMKKSIRAPGMVPYHEGAIRFFREVGQWSQDLENWNRKTLEQEKVRMAAWETLKKEAAEKKMTPKDLANTWMKSQGIQVE